MLDATAYVDARPPEQRRDPTGTHGIRRAFYQDISRRIARLKQSLRGALIDYDPDKNPLVYGTGPRQQIEMLIQFVANEINTGMLHNQGRWIASYVHAGYAKGAHDASTHMQRRVEINHERVDAATTLAINELNGMAQDMGRQIIRHAGSRIAAGDKRIAAFRAASQQLTKYSNRAKALVNVAVVSAHANASLDAFQAGGVTHVGTIPEHRPTQTAHDHLDAKQRAKARSKRKQWWQKPGQKFQLLTQGDDRVCDVCNRLEEDSPYTLAQARNMIPVHPNAVLEGSTIASYGPMHEMVRARFSGPAVYLRTGAKFFAIGPNHPMLTRRGWLKASEICEGDQLLYDLRTEGASFGGNANLKQMPMVQDVFEAATFIGMSLPTGTGHDLHGDRVFCEGEVNVVDPARSLLPILDPSGIEHFGKGSFKWSDMRAALEARLRSGNAAMERVFLATSRVVCGSHLQLALAHGHLGPLDLFLLAGGAKWNTGLPQNHIDDAAASAEFCSQSQNAGASQIGGYNSPFRWDRVLEVHVRQFSGWAFDGSTASSLYNNEGYVISNCRCAMVPWKGPLGDAYDPAKHPHKGHGVGGGRFAQTPDYSTHELPVSEVSTALERSEADEQKVQKYRSDIRAGRPLKPIHVVSTGEGFEAVDGQHRLWAHHDEGKSHIVARVYNSRVAAFKQAHEETPHEEIAADMPSVKELLRPEMAAAAQQAYNEWEQDEEGQDEELGSGGICQDIAEKMAGIAAEYTDANDDARIIKAPGKIGNPFHDPRSGKFTHSSKGEGLVKLTPVKTRVYRGEPVALKTKYSNDDIGRIATAIAMSYAKTYMKLKQPLPLTQHKGFKAFDMVAGDHAVEIKGGHVSNNEAKWKSSKGGLSAAEQKRRREIRTGGSAAKKARLKEFDADMENRIVPRKYAQMKTMSADLGRQLQPHTLGMIVNPDTRTADVFHIPGFEKIHRWKQLGKYYKGTFRYGA